jgi:hypothetical protein
VNWYAKPISDSDVTDSTGSPSPHRRTADLGAAMILAESASVTEGFALAQSTVYKTPIGKGLGPFSLTAPTKPRPAL